MFNSKSHFKMLQGPDPERAHGTELLLPHSTPFQVSKVPSYALGQQGRKCKKPSQLLCSDCANGARRMTWSQTNALFTHAK